MLKKTIRRLGALAMVLAMAVSVFAVNASAVDATANPQFKKTLTVTGTNAKLQFTETFNFTVTPDGQSTTTIYDNPGASAITVSPVTFGAGATTSTQDIDVVVDTESFKNKPGTYYYIIKETPNATDGMTYSSAAKKLAVQVYADNTITYYVVENGENNAKDNAEFVNAYSAHKLTVKKTVSGSQADKNESFDIHVTINGAPGETYETNMNGVTLTSGQEATISLKGGESIEIYNLSPTDTYVVDEDNRYAGTEGEGYTVTGEVTDATAIGNADANVTINNHRDASTPTGVIMTIAPYALMVVVAGAFAVVFLTRRNRAE